MNVRPAMPRPINVGARAATSVAASPVKAEVPKHAPVKPVPKAVETAGAAKSADLRVVGAAAGGGIVGGVAAAMLFAGGGAAIVVPAVIVGALFLGALGMWTGAMVVGSKDGSSSK